MSTSDPAQRYEACPLCEGDFANIVTEASGEHHEVRESAEACRYQESGSSLRLVFIHMEGSDD